MQHRHQSLAFSITALAAAVLSACGGGSDTSAVNPVGTTLTITGVAATGPAIAGKTVEAQCSGGSGSAVSQPDGNYSMPLTSGSLPCLVRVAADTSTTLYFPSEG
jgi:hypothetical protein